MTNVTTLHFPKTLRAVAVSLAAIAMTLFLTAGPAAAHASLTGSDPADGDTLAEAPEELVLEFSERLDAPSTQVALVAPDGEVVPLPDPAIEGNTLTQPGVFPAPGEYTFSYRIVSVDGHPVEGSIAFTLESVPEPTAPAEQPGVSDDATAAADEPAEGGTSWGVVGLIAAGVAIVVVCALLVWRKVR
ncbi:hypothetical protein FB566_3038 [Stackebrandtia endophytica]|uniref:CopC domain-containing protein n=1 Tax=Stackebrandtia endophytica TaxID=1496996 RepID=A0A543AY25_9ACTN|nr:copper resistance CopC family protein [Stackebrandtia endophytica]TQL77479.1 hypothetical protein FB566_3038 [Stackebrandtia endophytica]